MISILLVVNVLLSLSIIGLVMLQRGKGADAGAALGGGGGGGGGGASGSVFGARGAANFLSRTTAILAAAFFSTSLALAYFSANQQSATGLEVGSVIESPAIVVPTDVPAAADVPAVNDVPVAVPSASESAPVSDIPASE
ncbi:Protein translocase membrane subunit SecG [hydrothermal vent metagenome]|uniref:Protein translocase membrane subunit SecG n=1 Tax=hydrothermal vent metagenome TaxID=652676 RepID=A0A3B0WTQ6_9ZZZZ